MAEPDRASISPLLSYSAISSALLVPVLIWPLQGLNDGLNPSPDFHNVWLITASALLLCSVTADSILNHQPDSSWPFFATAWILISSMAVSLVLRTESGSFILAALFSLHAIRSGLRLWHGHESWWLWPACIRDTIAALSIFGWIISLSLALS